MLELEVLCLLRRLRCVIVLMALAHCAAPVEDEVHESHASSAVLMSPHGTVKWFFADGGSTVGGAADYHDFKTFYHFANLNVFPVPVTGRFTGEDGTWEQVFTLAADTRTTLEFTQLTGRTGFHSAEFYSNRRGEEIQVSATMVNDGFDLLPGAASAAFNGTTEARTGWLFGEGGTYGWINNAPEFDNWLIVYNPNNATIRVSGLFAAEAGEPLPMIPMPGFDVAGRGRAAVKLFATATTGPQMKVRSARIFCTMNCVAQLVMRQRAAVGMRQTSSQTALGVSPANDWYVVGIPTSANWQPRLYLYPIAGANVTLRYYSSAGTLLATDTLALPSGPRHTYDIRQEAIRNGTTSILDRDGDICLRVSSTQPLAITKDLHWPFDSDRWSEGAATTGHSQGGTRVILLGGTVGGGVSNYVEIMNVGSTPTQVWSTIYRGAGIAPVQYYLGFIPANGMRRLDASVAYPGLEGDFMTKLETDGGKIIAESSTFSQLDGDPPTWRAGDAVEGIVYDLSRSAFPLQP